MADGPQYDASVTNRFYARLATGDGSGSSSANKRAFSSYAADSAAGALNGTDSWLYWDSTPIDVGSGVTGGSGSSFPNRPHRLLGCHEEPGDLSDDLDDGLSRPHLTNTSSITRLLGMASGATVANLRLSSTAASGGAVVGFGWSICLDISGSTGSSRVGLDGGSGTAIGCRVDGQQFAAASIPKMVRCYLRGGQDAALSSSSPFGASGCVLVGGISNSWNLLSIDGSLLIGTPANRAPVTNAMIVAASGNPLSTRTGLVMGDTIVCRTAGNSVATATGSGDGIDLGGNLDLPIAPFVDLASGDLRLSAAGRAVPRIVRFMQGLPNVPLPTGWQRDDADTLAHYAAQLSGYKRGLSNPWAS